MRNPIRRNRNIGTPKQGHSNDNKFDIPTHIHLSKDFYERIGSYKKIEKIINGHSFVFITEATRRLCKHACSVADIERIIENISPSYYGDLKWIVFRQPKKKEHILSPVWGRLIYSYEFENEYHPAIIIEAVDCSKKLSWSKSQAPDDQKEFERLKNDGHQFLETRNSFSCQIDVESVRNTQLYRTFLHEFGHYVQYSKVVGLRIGSESFDSWEKRIEAYMQISKSEKEAYAHRFADELKDELKKKGIIPFERLNSSEG